MTATDCPYLDLSEEVRQALQCAKPVVALESTIITHGMPYPQNVQAALEVQAELRAHGAVPATIAIMAGRLKAGLSDAQIQDLGRGAGAVTKVSRRDIAFILAAGRSGATTVAATMAIAALAAIRVFATGGIGGVHRGAQHSFDVSADLQELAHTPVAVVCSGAKSILDLGLTLEYLETQGVPVIGYRSDWLPGFFTRDSAFALEYRIDSAAEIARVLHIKWRLALRGGVLIANPIPEQHAMDRAVIDSAIAQALAQAQAQGVVGKRVTPFLLQRLHQITGGQSLAANRALLLDNARLAAALAVQLSALGD